MHTDDSLPCLSPSGFGGGEKGDSRSPGLLMATSCSVFIAVGHMSALPVPRDVLRRSECRPPSASTS